MDCSAYVFPLHSWLFLDPGHPPQIRERLIGGRTFRFYPPFRARPSRFLTAAHVLDPRAIPVRPRRNNDLNAVRIQPPTFILPVFGVGPETPSLAPGNAAVTHHLLLPDGAFQQEPPDAELPRDSLRIDADAMNSHGDFSMLLGTQRRLMELVRWRTGQWWLTRSPEGLCSVASFGIPIRETGDFRLGVPSGFNRFQTLSGFERKLTDDVWRRCIDEVADGMIVPIYETLFLDAAYFSSVPDLRQAVLCAASACDIGKELTAKRLWLTRNPGDVYDESQRNALLGGWNMAKHLRSTFPTHFGRSYPNEHPPEWAEIERLWDARNNVAHGNENCFGSPLTTVTESHMRPFLFAAHHCIHWLVSLC